MILLTVWSTGIIVALPWMRVVYSRAYGGKKMAHANPGRIALLSLIPCLAVTTLSFANIDYEVVIHKIDKEGLAEPIGTIKIEKHRDGALIKPDLEGLTPGLHGFHLHQNPECGPTTDEKLTVGGAAGGHYDPDNSGSHLGPYGDGHLGDLPALYVDQDGKATQVELAPRLNVADFVGHALVIHQGGDNYSDEPEPLGGGGARIACGVVPLLLVPTVFGVTAAQQEDQAADTGQDPVRIEMNLVTPEGEGKRIGTIRITERAKGLLLEPQLEGLSPGLHGFHIHENSNCGSEMDEDKAEVAPKAVPAGQADDHWDPGLTAAHFGPYGHGHLGDLPNLYVDEKGVAEHPVYAPRVTLDDVTQGALIIHAKHDNYSDQPEKNGGSGDPVACGTSSTSIP